MKNTKTVYQNKDNDLKVIKMHTLNHGDYIIIAHGDCTYIYSSQFELISDKRCTMYSALPCGIYTEMIESV